MEMLNHITQKWLFYTCMTVKERLSMFACTCSLLSLIPNLTHLNNNLPTVVTRAIKLT